MRTRKKKLLSLLAAFAFAGSVIFARGAFLMATGHSAPVLEGRQVAVLAGEGLHDGETLIPIGFLVNLGADVTVLGVEPGYAGAYNSDFVVRIERSVDDVSFEDFDAVIIPGGRSPSFLRQHENVVAFVRSAVEADKVVAAICHGPQLLIAAGVVEGKNVTAFPEVAEELREAGAYYDDVPMMRDGSMITSRVPDDLPDFMEEVRLALLERNW